MFTFMIVAFFFKLMQFKNHFKFSNTKERNEILDSQTKALLVYDK